MNHNPALVKKFLQVTEESQAPIHVPIVLGNECFIVTQQDVRKIEDTRLLSYSKLGPNGELISMESLGHDGNIRDAILNACRCRLLVDQNVDFTELIARVCGQINQAMNTSQAMPQFPIKASLEQQLQWAKAPNNTSAPYPLTYTSATSTTEISPRIIRFQRECNAPCCRGQRKAFCNRCTNTMEIDEAPTQFGSGQQLSAREQLKQKKLLAEDFNNND